MADTDAADADVVDAEMAAGSAAALALEAAEAAEAIKDIRRNVNAMNQRRSAMFAENTVTSAMTPRRGSVSSPCTAARSGA